MEIEKIKLDAKTMPKCYGQAGALCAKDFVAIVRKKYKDPRQPVVLTCREAGNFAVELKDSLIYVDGVTSEKVDDLLALGKNCYALLELSALDFSKSDCGLEQALPLMFAALEPAAFEILVEDGDRKDILKLWDYTNNNGCLGITVNYPSWVASTIQLLPKGLDIDVFVKRLAQLRTRNALDIPSLKAILRDLDDAIVNGGKTAIQNLNLTRTQDCRLLTLYANLKYQLSPVYLATHIQDYVSTEIIYPRSKMSLYERLMFLRSLPMNVGYIGCNSDFRCLFQVSRLLYPKPHYVFDLRRGALADPEDFNLENLQLGDFRSSFKSSSSMLGSAELTDDRVTLAEDLKEDDLFVRRFSNMETAVKDEEIYLSIKNSVLVQKDGSVYLAYCPEPLGVLGVLESEYFGHKETVIAEQDFKNFIDAKVVLAINRQQAATTKELGAHAFSEVMAVAKPTLAPAVPLDVQLYYHMLPIQRNGLSYFDRCLRCGINIVPIITDIDSPLCDKNPLFDMVSLQALRNDKQANNGLNCFGTIMNLSKDSSIIPVTIDAFRGRRLL